MKLLSLFKGLAKKAQAASLIGIGVFLIVGIIALKIVSDVVINSSFTGLTGTVASYITVGLAVGLLVVAFGIAMK